MVENFQNFLAWSGWLLLYVHVCACHVMPTLLVAPVQLNDHEAWFWLKRIGMGDWLGSTCRVHSLRDLCSLIRLRTLHVHRYMYNVHDYTYTYMYIYMHVHVHVCIVCDCMIYIRITRTCILL